MKGTSNGQLRLLIVIRIGDEFSGRAGSHLLSLIYTQTFARGRGRRRRSGGSPKRRFLIGPWTLPTEHVEIATFTRLPLAHDCSRTLKLGWV